MIFQVSFTLDGKCYRETYHVFSHKVEEFKDKMKKLYPGAIIKEVGD